MKYLALVVFLVYSLLAGVSCNSAPSASESKTTQSKENVAVKTSKIEILDFYSTHRCMTCEAIEAHTRYTVEEYFEEEVEAGKITLRFVNVDEEENYALAEKFQATGTALFLNVVVEGEEEQIDLTAFAFAKGREKEAFAQELKTYLDTELKKL